MSSCLWVRGPRAQGLVLSINWRVHFSMRILGVRFKTFLARHSFSVRSQPNHNVLIPRNVGGIFLPKTPVIYENGRRCTKRWCNGIWRGDGDTWQHVLLLFELSFKASWTGTPIQVWLTLKVEVKYLKWKMCCLQYPDSPTSR